MQNRTDMKAEAIRQEWKDFSHFVDSLRNKVEEGRNKMLKELKMAFVEELDADDQIKCDMARIDYLQEKNKLLSMDLWPSFVGEARNEWRLRMQKAGVSMSDWANMTEEDMEELVLALGDDWSDMIDRMPKSSPGGTSKKRNTKGKLPSPASRMQQPTKTDNRPRVYPPDIKSDIGQWPPEVERRVRKRPHAAPEAHPDNSPPFSHSRKIKIPYVGPLPGMYESEMDSREKEVEDGNFETFKMNVRKILIEQFHEEALKMEVGLMWNMYATDKTRGERRDIIEQHLKNMEKLMTDLNEERIKIVDNERKKWWEANGHRLEQPHVQDAVPAHNETPPYVESMKAKARAMSEQFWSGKRRAPTLAPEEEQRDTIPGSSTLRRPRVNPRLQKTPVTRLDPIFDFQQRPSHTSSPEVLPQYSSIGESSNINDEDGTYTSWIDQRLEEFANKNLGYLMKSSRSNSSIRSSSSSSGASDRTHVPARARNVYFAPSIHSITQSSWDSTDASDITSSYRTSMESNSTVQSDRKEDEFDRTINNNRSLSISTAGPSSQRVMNSSGMWMPNVGTSLRRPT